MIIASPLLSAALTSLEWSLWRATWQASVLAGIVLVLQKLLGRRLGGHGRYVLWIIVIVRLLLPVSPQSRWSLFNLTNRHEPPVVARAVQDRATQIETNAKPQAAIHDIAIVQTEPIPRRIDWSKLAPLLLGAAWIGGIVVLIANVVASCWWLRRVQRSLHVVTDARILAIVESSRQLLSLRYTPRCLWGDSVSTPAVVGFFRPALWLPTQVLTQCDEEQIRLVILHELAHLKRNDVLGNWLIAAATIVHWFNPIVWLVAMRMRSDRELACDELVLSVSNTNDAKAYGQTLVRLVEILSTPRSIPQPQVVGILESTGPMKRRVCMIARFNPSSIHRSSRWFWTFALLLGLGCTTLTDAVHGDDTNKPQPAAAQQPQKPQSDPRAVKPVANAAEHPQDKAELEHLLQQVLPDVKFDSLGFTDAIDFLRDTTGANVIVEWRVLENAGIDRNTPVSLNMRRVRVEEVLDHILRDVGANSARLDYMIDRGAVVISTEEALATRSVTITYDVSDLMVGPTGESLAEVDYHKKLAELTNLITSTIAPESWREVGGVTSGLSTFNNKIVIQSTPKIQQQIQHLLERLREQPTTQPRPLEP